MAISTAIGTDRVSRILGYQLTAGNFATVTPNLPQRIAIVGEANTSNQATFPTDGTQILTAQEAGQKYGFGSPIYNVMRILKPVTSDGVGGIPVIVYAQAEGANVAKEMTITVTGTAAANETHYVKLNGRTSIDGQTFSVSITDSDTATVIGGKIADAINNVLGASVTATNAAGVVTLVSKWKGLTSQDINVEMVAGDNAATITYAVAQTVAGSGTPSIATDLAKFGNDWNTIVINTYGIDATTVMDELESFNGKPDPTTPTGRFTGSIFKPFIALTGSLADSDLATDTAETVARRNEQTIAVCPAPASNGLAMEAAANMGLLFSLICQNTPHLDVAGKYYPDMPVTDNSTIVMSDYDQRDAYVKNGYTTVDLENGAYKIIDFVTTYHPVGELVPQYRYSRNLMIDFNVKFGYRLLEEINVVDHAIAGDDDVVNADKVIKPKEWKGIIFKYAEDLSKRSLIADPGFMQDNTNVGLSSTNPDRLETFFRYKRSGFVRIAATTAEAGFNFGNN